MKSTLSTILLAVVLLSSCKKKEDTAPSTSTTNNTTASGSYYFKCKINGTDWVATKPVGTDSMSAWGERAYVIQNKTGANLNQLLISVMPFSDTTWALESAVYVSSTFKMYTSSFVMSSLSLSVKRDSVNKIVSGTFAFPLLNSSDDKDTLKITGGSFRVKY